MQLLEFLITYFFQKHHEVRMQSNNVASLLQAIYYFQLISLISQTEFKHDDVPTLFNLLNIFYYLNQICRPYQFLVIFSKFRSYCFLVPAVFNFLLTLDIDYKIITEYIQTKMKVKQKTKKHFKEYTKILSIILQIHYYIFSLYTIDLILISLVESTNILKSNAGLFSICLVILLKEICFIFINILCSESIHFQSSSLHIHQLSSSQFITFISIVISIYLNHSQLNQSSEIAFHLFNIQILIFYLYQETKKSPKLMQKISLIILTYGFCYNVSYFLILIVQSKYQVIIVFLLCPFFLNLFIHCQKVQNSFLFGKERTIEQIYNNLKIFHNYSTLSNTDYQIENSYSAVEKKDQSIYLCIISIGIKSFDHELILFNEKILKLSTKYRTFWYQKYIAIQYARKNYKETISCIYNFTNSMLYSEVKKQFIKTKTSLTFLQQFQLNQLKQDSYLLLNSQITITQGEDEKLLTFSFIKYKIKAQAIQQDILDIMERKKTIYQSLFESKYKGQNKAFNDCYQLSEQALSIKTTIRSEIMQHKTFQLQQLGVLLLAEFFNNILEAQQLQYMQLGNEDIQQNELESMEFLNLRLSDNLIDLKIEASSCNFFSMLGYDKQLELSFSDLFPEDFFSVHQDYVQKFLTTGNCRFINNIQELIIKGNNNIFFYSQFQLSMELHKLNGIHFYSFFKVTNEQPKSIFINKAQLIVGLTKPFQSLLTELCLSYQSLYQLDINMLIPQFSQLQYCKTLKLHFDSNQQEFSAIILEKLNLIELQILDDSYKQNEELESEIKAQMFSYSSINQESLISKPAVFNQENLLSPLSEERRDLVSQMLLQIQTQKGQTLKTFNNSEKESYKNRIKSNKYGNVGQDQIDNDQASSKYSRGIFDNSIYSAKYFQLSQFLTEQKRITFVQISTFLFALFVLINLIFQILILIYFSTSYQAIADTDLLVLKSKLITPIHNCVTAQVCVIDYILLMDQFQEISKAVGIEKMKFAYDSIDKTYTMLKNSYSEQLNNQNILFLLNDQQLEVSQIDGSHLTSRNISLINILYNYEEAQYYVTQNSSESQILQIPTNDDIYYMTNIVKLDDYFDTLSNQVNENVTTKAILFGMNQTTFFLKLIYLQLFVAFLTSSFHLRNQDTYSQYYRLFTSLNSFALQKENKKLSSLIGMFQGKDTLLYQFDAAIWEKDIQSQQMTMNVKINQSHIKNQEFNSSKKYQFIMLFLFLLFFFLPQFIFQQIVSDYFIKYQNSCIMLEELSQITSAVSAIYEFRETNYMISSRIPFFYFISDEKRLEQNDKIQKELDKISMFLSSFPKIDYSQLLVNDAFMTFVSNLTTESICNYLIIVSLVIIIEFSQELAQEHCNNIYQGVMNIGLINTISEIYNQISQEFQSTNGFQASSRSIKATFDEAEIGLITSDALLNLQSELVKCIIGSTQYVQLIQQVLAIIYIFISIILGISIFYYYRPTLAKQSSVIRNMIFLIPRYQFYLEQKFETNFRLLIMQNR